ncbi:hypothetical protein IMSAG117_01336 [Lactobacillaceae bacterium]|nr:hypothetical protein IMSAG117_01336 [Lactobacillaceae bacterium]
MLLIVFYGSNSLPYELLQSESLKIMMLEFK